VKGKISTGFPPEGGGKIIKAGNGLEVRLFVDGE